MFIDLNGIGLSVRFGLGDMGGVHLKVGQYKIVPIFNLFKVM